MDAEMKETAEKIAQRARDAFKRGDTIAAKFLWEQADICKRFAKLS